MAEDLGLIYECLNLRLKLYQCTDEQEKALLAAQFAQAKIKLTAREFQKLSLLYSVTVMHKRRKDKRKLEEVEYESDSDQTVKICWTCNDIATRVWGLRTRYLCERCYNHCQIGGEDCFKGNEMSDE